MPVSPAERQRAIEVAFNAVCAAESAIRDRNIEKGTAQFAKQVAQEQLVLYRLYMDDPRQGLSRQAATEVLNEWEKTGVRPTS